MKRALYTWLVWVPSERLLSLLVWLIWGGFKRGRQRVPKRGPMLLVSNHQSHLDPILVGNVTWGRANVSLARSTLFKFKPFGWLIKMYKSVPLRQGESDHTAFRIVLDALKRGDNVLVFPEGTRSRDGSLGEFQTGVLLLIRRGKVPVVPIAVDGAHDIWPIGQKFPNLRGRCGVMAGEPIGPEEWKGLSHEGMMDLLRSRIDALRLQVRAELRERTNGRWPRPGPGDKPLVIPETE